MQAQVIRTFGIFPQTLLVKTGEGEMTFLTMGENLERASEETFTPNGDNWEPLISYISSDRVSLQDAKIFARRVYERSPRNDFTYVKYLLKEAYRREQVMDTWIWGDFHADTRTELSCIYGNLIASHRGFRALWTHPASPLRRYHTLFLEGDTYRPSKAQIKKQLEDTIRRREKVTRISSSGEDDATQEWHERVRAAFSKIDKLIYLELWPDSESRIAPQPAVVSYLRYEAYLKETGQLPCSKISG